MAAATAPRLRATRAVLGARAFEADNRSRMFYQVSGFDGEMVSGFEDLPRLARHACRRRAPYAALVDFYDDRYRGEPVRVAVLLQPVAGSDGRGMATIQVAETLELRQTLARQILIDTLWRQALLVLVIALVVVWVVQRATRPVRELSAQLRSAPRTTWRRSTRRGAPRELLPLVDATNQVMARLAHLLAHQKRFVRDAAHQLRTPLAVLQHAGAVGAARRRGAGAGAAARSSDTVRARHAAGQPDAGAGQGRAAAPAGRRAGASTGPRSRAPWRWTWRR